MTPSCDLRFRECWHLTVVKPVPHLPKAGRCGAPAEEFISVSIIDFTNYVRPGSGCVRRSRACRVLVATVQHTPTQMATPTTANTSAGQLTTAMGATAMTVEMRIR